MRRLSDLDDYEVEKVPQKKQPRTKEELVLQKRKQKIKVLCVLAGIVLLVTAITVIVKKFANEDTQVTIKVAYNQELIYADIVSINGNEMTYQETEEGSTNTILIPVGTEVTTKLGTVTTFSRLAAGDNIAILMQNNGNGQQTVGIWIVE